MDNPLALREAIHYISKYKNKSFVIHLPGDIIKNERFLSIASDLLLLRELGIHIIIVFSLPDFLFPNKDSESFNAEYYISEIKEDEIESFSKECSNIGFQIHTVLSSLRTKTNKFSDSAIINLFRPRRRGIINGNDYLYQGVVDKIYLDRIQTFLKEDIILISIPMAPDSEGRLYYINGLELASTIAQYLGNCKLLLYTEYSNISDKGERIGQITQHTLEEYLQEHETDPTLKHYILQTSIQAIKGGVNRVHIINPEEDGAILKEIFSSKGSDGIMVYSDKIIYENIRPALSDDLAGLYELISPYFVSGKLLFRSLDEIRDNLSQFFIYEVDNIIKGAVAFRMDKSKEFLELYNLVVNMDAVNQGIGKKLLKYMETFAKAQGVKTIIVKTTQSEDFFKKNQFQTIEISKLPKVFLKNYTPARKPILLKKDL